MHQIDRFFKTANQKCKNNFLRNNESMNLNRGIIYPKPKNYLLYLDLKKKWYMFFTFNLILTGGVDEPQENTDR